MFAQGLKWCVHKCEACVCAATPTAEPVPADILNAGHTKSPRPGFAITTLERARVPWHLWGSGNHVAWLTHKEQPAPRTRRFLLRVLRPPRFPHAGRRGALCTAGRWIVGRGVGVQSRPCPRPLTGKKRPDTCWEVGIPVTVHQRYLRSVIPPRPSGTRTKALPGQAL